MEEDFLFNITNYNIIIANYNQVILQDINIKIIIEVEVSIEVEASTRAINIIKVEASTMVTKVITDIKVGVKTRQAGNFMAILYNKDYL